MKVGLADWRTFLHVGLVAAALGCATSRLSEVKSKLATYMVGTTTFTDFKKDADVVLKEEPPSKSRTVSYLAPPPSLPGRRYYKTANGSAWRIFEQRESFSFSHGQSSSAVTLVVGDVREPIAILTFQNGTLSELRPVTQVFVPQSSP